MPEFDTPHVDPCRVRPAGKAPRLTSGFRTLPLLLILLLDSGCSRVPRIIVLTDPLTAAEHVELGVAYERKGDLELALREYGKALRKDKTHFQARVNLGNVYLAKKDFEKARGEYLRALDLRPGDVEATNNLGWCAILSGAGIEEALVRMENTVSGPAGSLPAFLDTLGVLRMRAGRPEAAAEAFALAERLCVRPGAVSEEGAACPEQVRREIEEHRRELSRRFLPPSPPASGTIK